MLRLNDWNCSMARSDRRETAVQRTIRRTNFPRRTNEAAAYEPPLGRKSVGLLLSSRNGINTEQRAFQHFSIRAADSSCQVFVTLIYRTASHVAGTRIGPPFVSSRNLISRLSAELPPTNTVNVPGSAT